jgi:phosphocarrier protein FPr
MVGIVVVSHSRRLAEAAVELALQMANGNPPPIEIAAGLDGGVLGTDAVQVSEAINRVATADGVLVLMDLGSAVLSAELALDLRTEHAVRVTRAGGADCPVVLSDGPLVEGLVAAVVLSAAGAGLAEVAAEASGAADIKVKLLGAGPPVPAAGDDEPPADASIELVLRNEHGLHARPAALLVETVRRFDADVRIANLTAGGPAVSARSVSAVSTLGALRHHRIEVRARGRQAREVLAATSALVGRNFHETVVTPGAPAPAATSPGIGIGPKVSLRRGVDGGAPLELPEAVARTRDELTALRRRVAATAGEHEAAIFDAHLLLLDDLEAAASEQGWSEAVDAVAGRFAALEDPYLRSRADDVRAVGQQVLNHVAGRTRTSGPPVTGVLVAADLTPAEAAALDPERVKGIVLASGSAVSHGAILARSLGIPAVIGAGDGVLALADGTLLVVDGSAGTVTVDPDADSLAGYVAQAEADRSRRETLLAAASSPARTVDGVRVEVAANVGSAADAALAVRNGADSIGLLRTEFLFLDRRQPPGEDEQLAAYRAIAAEVGRRRLTIRTLDAGGDKPLPYLATASTSPLGCRGIRLSLREPELFKVQLRAIVRLGREHPVTVLFPMLATVDELVDARRLLFEVAGGVLPEGLEVGAMVEVPAFALRAGAAVDLVDVFSIGTNDLTQYTMAADRGDPAVAHLADPLHPAVLRLIAEVADAARGRVRVAVCGEVAADPANTGLLLGLGVGELSVNPPAIPAVKDAVRSSPGRR